MKLLLQLYWIFFRIGTVTFGGGYAMISLIHQEVVSRGLCTEAEFADMVALSQITPGTVALNAATFMGKASAGVPGALAATLGIITPSLILTSLILWLSGRIRTGRWSGALKGVRAAAAGLIFSAVWFFAENSLFKGKMLSGSLLSGDLNWQWSGPDLLGLLVFVFALLAIRKWKRPSYEVILMALCIGVLWFGALTFIHPAG